MGTSVRDIVFLERVRRSRMNKYYFVTDGDEEVAKTLQAMLFSVGVKWRGDSSRIIGNLDRVGYTVKDGWLSSHIVVPLGKSLQQVDISWLSHLVNPPPKTVEVAGATYSVSNIIHSLQPDSGTPGLISGFKVRVDGDVEIIKAVVKMAGCLGIENKLAFPYVTINYLYIYMDRLTFGMSDHQHFKANKNKEIDLSFLKLEDSKTVAEIKAIRRQMEALGDRLKALEK